MNLNWLPDGIKLTKVIVSPHNFSELEQQEIEKIKRIAKEIKDIELLLEFGHQNYVFPLDEMKRDVGCRSAFYNNQWQ